MRTAPLPNKVQREAMQKHRLAPKEFLQADVMRKLKLIDVNAFYRLFYRCTIVQSKEDYQE